MKASALAPEVHVLVCTNRRDPASPLGPGCGAAGETLLSAMRREVGARRAYRSVWVTETRCLGLCPREGAAVAVYGTAAGRATPGLLTEVREDDLPELARAAFGVLR